MRSNSGPAPQRATHEIVVKVLIHEQPNHRLRRFAALTASQKPSAHTNRINTRLDLPLLDHCFSLAPGQIRVDFGGVIEVVRNDLIDIRQCHSGKSLRDFFRSRSGAKRG